MEMLNVGDKVISFWYGSAQSQFTVERVTKTQAVLSGNIKVRKETYRDGSLIPVGAYSRSISYRVQTPELLEKLKSEIEFRKLIKLIDNCTFKDLGREKLKRICEIIGGEDE